MAEKKTEASKARAARATKSGAKKTGSAKTPARKTAAAKAAAESRAAAPAKKLSAAREKAKAEKPTPERVPGRKERRGIVVSDVMDKTVVVRVDRVSRHGLYGKVVRRSKKLHVHDEHNTAGIGDVVRVVETRPLSATKRWRLLEVVEKAK